MAKWTENEVMLLRLNMFVPLHTASACRAKASALGFSYCPKQKLVKWTRREDNLLRKGKRVPGRSLRACHTRACKIGLKHYAPISPNTGRRISAELKDMIAERVRKTRCIRATGRIFGVSYNAVMEICRKRGIVVNPSSRDRLGEYIDFEGVRYTHTGHGSWRATTGTRENLAWIMWNRYHPEDPIRHEHKGIKRYGIAFLNHDIRDFRKENLAKMNQSDFTKWLYNDPKYRAMQYIYGVTGLAKWREMEDKDPELKKKRVEHGVQTRRERGIYDNVEYKQTWTEEEMDSLRNGDMEPALARHTRCAVLRMRGLIKRGIK